MTDTAGTARPASRTEPTEASAPPRLPVIGARAVTRPGPGTARRLAGTRLVGIVFVALLLGLWQLLTAAKIYQSPNVPELSAIFTRWYDDMRSGPLLSDVLVLLRTTAIGFALAAVVGIVLGVLMARIRFVWALLEPVIELLRPIPIAAFIPILVLFLGIEDKMKIGAIFFAGIFPILLNSYAGASSISPSMRDTARTFRLSWFQTTKEIVVPAAAPLIFVGLRISMSICLIIAVVAEMIAGNNGLGYFILNSEQMFDIQDMYVGIFTIALVGYLLNFAFLLIEKTVLRWHYGSLRG
jgi:ABC-type nitrate/sulfonate/bicarbonate transport system permease component